MTDPDPITQTAAPATLRSDVGAAVGRAWDRAVAAGSLPAWPDDAVRPAIEIERPADAVHGDFASNLAMKLARPYRMAPLAIGAALAAELVAEAAADPAGTPVASAEVAPPGFLNLRLRDGALESTIAAILADPPAWGRVAGGSARVRQRRVRVGQPDRTAARRECARGVHRRHAQPGPRGGRSASHARVLLQRLGRPDPEPGRIAGRDQARRTRPRRRLQGRLRRRSRGGAARRRVGRGDRRRTPTPTASSGTGRPDASARASRPAWPGSASASTSGPARLASTRRAGSSARSSACASAATSTSRTARPGSARPTSATTRTG